MLTEIFDTLDAGGINTYFIGQHRGECFKPYAVVKDSGSSAIKGTSINRSVIDIILFYPFGKFSNMEEYAEGVKTVLKKLVSLRDARYRSPVIVDEEKKAYTTTLRYWRYQAYSQKT